MLLHINPTRQRGKRTGSLARAAGWYMTFFAAWVIFATREVPEGSSAVQEPVMLTEPNARKGARQKKTDLLDVSVITVSLNQ